MNIQIQEGIFLKRCTKCGEEKPATAEYFIAGKRYAGGIRAQCKDCDRNYRRSNKERRAIQQHEWYEANRERVSERGREWRDANKERKAENDRAYRIANPERMKQWRAANKEHVEAYRREYYRANKEIRAERYREWYLVNREKRIGYSRQWREANSGHVLEYRQKYYAFNTDRLIAYRKKYYAAHSEEVKEKVHQWYANNKERASRRARAYRIANPEVVKAIHRRRKAHKRNAEGNHSATDIAAQYKAQRGKCYYCKRRVGDTYHVDHVVPLSRGGSNGPENLVIACPFCNQSKNNKLPHEWPQGGRLI